MKKREMLALALAGGFYLSFIVPHAMAGDDGLYGSAPPPGSAFVRFVNGDAGTRLKGDVRGKAFPTVAGDQAGPYLPVQQGEAKIALGSASTTYTLKSGAHYSAVLDKGKLAVLEEPANDNKLKTQIVLLNLSGKDVSLKTADGAVSVISPVEPGKLGARPVNAVKAAFAVYAGNDKIASLEERSLERGAGYAIVVSDGAQGKPVVNYDKATGL